MATNILGESVEPALLTCKKEGNWLTFLRDGKFCGYMAKNGWSGKAAFIDYPIGEPVIHGLHGQLSITELKNIIEAWNTHFPKT